MLNFVISHVFSSRPLHIAARNGLVPVVQDLIRKGGSVLALDENGKTLGVLVFFFSVYLAYCKRISWEWDERLD